MLGLNWAGQFGAACRQWILAARGMRNTVRQGAVQKVDAEQRSRSLLLTLLNDAQRHEFNTYGYFHVTGGRSGNTYRIRTDPAVNIDVLTADGAVQYYLCARPVGNIPIYDAMAGQLLYLQDSGAETRFLEHAIRHGSMPFAPIGYLHDR